MVHQHQYQFQIYHQVGLAIISLQHLALMEADAIIKIVMVITALIILVPVHYITMEKIVNIAFMKQNSTWRAEEVCVVQ